MCVLADCLVGHLLQNFSKIIGLEFSVSIFVNPLETSSYFGVLLDSGILKKEFIICGRLRALECRFMIPWS